MRLLNKILLLILLYIGLYSCYSNKFALVDNGNIYEYRLNPTNRIILNKSNNRFFISSSIGLIEGFTTSTGEWNIKGDTLILHTIPDSCYHTVLAWAYGYLDNKEFKFIKDGRDLIYDGMRYQFYMRRAANETDIALMNPCGEIESQSHDSSRNNFIECNLSDSNGTLTEYSSEIGEIFLEEVHKTFWILLRESGDYSYISGTWKLHEDTLKFAINEGYSQFRTQSFIVRDNGITAIKSDSTIYFDNCLFKFRVKRTLSRADSIVLFMQLDSKI